MTAFPFRPRNVRVRLTLWYVAALAAVLAVYAVVVFVFVRHALLEALDNELSADVERARNTIDEWTAAGIAWADSRAEVDPDDVTLWMQVVNQHGEVLFRSPAAERLPLAEPHSVAVGAGGWPRSMPAEDGGSLRVLIAAVEVANEPVSIRVARSETALQHELDELALILIAGVPAGIGFAGFGGYVLARRALAPVNHMSERARTITAERLTDRLPVENPNDELGRLAATFNDVLTRLQSSFERMRQFTADASHELRTPLTAIRSVGEDALRERRSQEGYRDVIGSMLEESHRLTALVDTLLTLSRTDAGEQTLPREPVDVCQLVREVASDLSVLAEEKGQAIAVEGVADPILANRMALRQALMNLVDNAIKYGPAGRPIRVHVSTSPTGEATIDVIDQGPGIPPAHRAKIFQRFYRIDGARSRERGGAGLGLAVARSAVERQGGRLECHEASGGGSAFRITLPREALST